MVACPRRTPSLNCWRNAPQGSQTFHSKSVSATVLSKKNREPLPQQPVEAEIETLSHEGRGLAHINGKAVFVHGALAGERVLLRYTRRQRHFDEGVVTQVLHASPQRVRPRCPHADICGGCSLQHMGPSAQVSMKQEILVDVLRRIGKVEPIEWLAPLTAGHWGYRRKARLGVRYVAKKGRTLVGFRERGTSISPTPETRTRCTSETSSSGTPATAGSTASPISKTAWSVARPGTPMETE